MLESMCHKSSAFVTLTYSQEHFPADGSLDPAHLQAFMKRIRRQVEYHRLAPGLRFYGVGEYGDRSFRPHYHLALFGYPSCVRGRTEHRLPSCCGPCDLVRESWSLGGVDLGQLTIQSASYVVGYVTKKMTKTDDPRLNGRHPEFARMSLRPGIGALSVSKIAELVQSAGYADKLEKDGDVPLSLMQGRKSMPLGRYLRRKLREEIGRSADTPESVMGRVVEEMSALLGEVKKEAEMDGTPGAFMDKKSLVQRANIQKIRNVEARAKIYSQERPL